MFLISGFWLPLKLENVWWFAQRYGISVWSMKVHLRFELHVGQLNLITPLIKIVFVTIIELSKIFMGLALVHFQKYWLLRILAKYREQVLDHFWSVVKYTLVWVSNLIFKSWMNLGPNDLHNDAPGPDPRLGPQLPQIIPPGHAVRRPTREKVLDLYFRP